MADSTVTLKIDGVDETTAAIVDRSYFFESAITSIAEAAKGAQDLTLLVLQAHLKDLCAAQLAFLSPAKQPEGRLYTAKSAGDRRLKAFIDGVEAKSAEAAYVGPGYIDEIQVDGEGNAQFDAFGNVLVKRRVGVVSVVDDGPR